MKRLYALRFKMVASSLCLGLGENRWWFTSSRGRLSSAFGPQVLLYSWAGTAAPVCSPPPTKDVLVYGSPLGVVFLIFSFFLASCLVCWLTYVLPSCRSFSPLFSFFCLLPCFPPHRSYALCRYLHPLPRVVFVRETAELSFSCFLVLSVQQQLSWCVLFCLCNRYLFVFSTYVVLAAFPFRSSCIAFFRTPLVRLFVLFCSVFSLVFSPFFPLFSMVWLVLLCSRTRYASIFTCFT